MVMENDRNGICIVRNREGSMTGVGRGVQLSPLNDETQPLHMKETHSEEEDNVENGSKNKGKQLKARRTQGPRLVKATSTAYCSYHTFDMWSECSTILRFQHHFQQ